MSSTEEKCKSLQQKLNLFPTPHPDSTTTNKLYSLQDLLNKLYQNYEEESISNEFKLKDLLNLVKKLESGVKDQCEAIDMKEEMNRMKIARVEKIARKNVEKIVKERKETEKKVNSHLESCLIDLTSAKTRSTSSCKFSIKQLNSLETTINGLEVQIQAEEAGTQQISKKIFAQYSGQIQELLDVMGEQRKQKEAEEAKIVDKLQKTYLKMHKKIEESRRKRQQSEEQLVNFLEKVIEKVRREMLRQ